AELPSEIAASILPPKIDQQTNGHASSQQDLIPADLNEVEKRIWPLLPADDSIHIDVLLETSGLSFGDLNSALVALDIRDLIRVLPGKNYARRI
ncbi:MAG: hypothetical protein ACJ72Z_10935, partial [Pyrinomonadaceae bacterium]